MRFDDEQYVKLYKRDTPTWRAMCWQARALLPLLLRVLDGAGLMECGQLGRGAVALMVGLPEEVCAPGLADLERLGVVVWHGDVLEMPRFLEAQEAVKTEALKKRDQRTRARDIVRAQAVGIIQGLSPDVPQCPAVSPDVPRCPPPAHPSPSQPSSVFAGKKRPRPKTAPEEVKTDPRHAPLVRVVCETYLEERHAPYPFDGRQAKLVSQLLERAGPEALGPAWRSALRHVGYPSVSTLKEFSDNLPHFLGTGPPRGAQKDPRKGTARVEDQDYEQNGIPF